MKENEPHTISSVFRNARIWCQKHLYSIIRYGEWRKLGMYCCALLCLLCSTIYIIQTCVIHRIYSASDVSIILETSFAPIVSPRCKAISSFSSPKSGLRCLPNVFFIGASKAGTTSLVHYLQQLSNIYFTQRRLHPTDKHTEIHRFDRSGFVKTSKWLELLHEWSSSPLLPAHPTGTNSLLIHYTPHYLYAPAVPTEIASLFPPETQSELRFIVLLRDPLERTISSYWFKHSHLFGESDSGSIEDLSSSIDREIQERSVHEKCILQYHIEHAQYHVDNIDNDINFALSSSDPAIVRTAYLKFLLSMVTTAQQLLKHGYPPVKYDKVHPPPPTVRVSGLTFLQQDHYQALETCFGPQKFRKASLGLHHVQKSIYVDQLVRWLLHFPIKHFLFVSSATLSADTKPSLLQLLQQLQVSKDHNSSNDSMLKIWEQEIALLNVSSSEQRLVRPNKKYKLLAVTEAVRIEAFFEPYQHALRQVLALQREE